MSPPVPWLLAWLLAALAPACAHTATSPSDAATAPWTLEVRPFRGPLRAVEVTAAGAPRTFLFDTGGGLTIISPELAAAVGCEPSGRLTGFRMSGERLDLPICRDVTLTIAGHAVSYPTVGVLDVHALMPPDWPPVAGMLSLQSLSGRRVVLALGEQEVRVDGGAEAPAPRTRQIRQASGVSLTLLAAVRARGRTLWFLLDSGCFSEGVIVAPSTARLLGLDASSGAPGTASLELVGVGPLQAPAVVEDIIYDGVVCAPLFDRLTLALDLRGTPLL